MAVGRLDPTASLPDRTATGTAHAPAPPRTDRSSLTVIVPTRNESGNVAELVRRLDDTLAPLRDAGHTCSIVFVDDSEDDTPATVERTGEGVASDVYCIHRPADVRWGGLGGAVVDGLRGTGSEFACVIDGDLQHPPELVAELWARARQPGQEADVVVASRYCAEGSSQGLERGRTTISRSMTRLARWAFPATLRSVTDPMSGFFLVRRSALDVERLAPEGFKILLEILVRHPGLRVAEIPFSFGDRFAGDSKADLAVGLSYLRHVRKLRKS
jgi:dolichol-phosphate mannosyltransferase